MARPDFAQFAEECANYEDDNLRQMHRLIEQAERHARLLETIQRWSDEDYAVTGREFWGIETARRIIREILEQE